MVLKMKKDFDKWNKVKKFLEKFFIIETPHLCGVSRRPNHNN